MLAFAIRGFVLLSVIGWYSNSVWKMIDGYFRDKFNKYLREEYQKYPQMKKDVQLTEREINEIVETAGNIDRKHREELLKENSENNNFKEEFNLNSKTKDVFKFNNKDGKKDRVEVKSSKENLKKKKLKFKNSSRDKVRGEIYNADDDFSEFESDDDKKTKFKGIRVSSLAFKPKADIGSLDIVSEDEFCPISLNDYDEETCRETKVWP
ncbi:uncharacterized protein LOC123270619 [Cotesia glomerata]|uniref:Uncharacterized protein n=1 Tax=Cotesia glomerata TaxID=32391 RepID=A0AAV7IHZ9_COTGL|nr:uncharacterized protein LOC123270619 [Cotesia glomerata]KAH0552119.1 hypothetical protein KQX54_005933 [Cotesia glomerata]